VEAQHRVGTRKLVDSLAEQEVLEAILEDHKPPLPADAAGYHYLLATPFRYPPLAHGSRFGTRQERGIWYGAETLATVFAEVAYYRLLFLHGSQADLGCLEVPLTVYRIAVDTPAGIDLAGPACAPYREVIASKTAYTQTQALGQAMREAGVRAFRYPSARAPAGGTCVGVFAPEAFAARRPGSGQTWTCFATRELVELVRHTGTRAARHTYTLGDFLVDGRLPAPAA
jgi:hypothetical protein